MSLRDQLLAKGLATKKDARRTANQARLEKKKRKGDQKKRREQARVEAERAAALEAQRVADRREAELRTREALETLEAAHRIHMLVEDNRVGRRGRVPFHHRGLDGLSVPRLWVDEATARRLMGGHLAIAGYVKHDGTARYATVSAQGAAMLEEQAPKAVLFWNKAAVDSSDPTLAAGMGVSEPSLDARRLR
ncbi:MAG: DUF2058 family protein [Proteobacteria bacterium]|nr:DUF2058 family protein [Pseudomonadota bacterium]